MTKLPSLLEAISHASRAVEHGERPTLEATAVILRAIKNLPEIARLCDMELASAGRSRQTVTLALNVRDMLDFLPPVLVRTDPLPGEDI
jgi:hypothetical protein